MTTDLILGIDLGTSGCKSILIDPTGRVVATSLREYPIHTPRAGWVEQHPADWWEGVQSGLAELLASPGVSPANIRAVGLSGQMHGLVALDANREVIRPAILWNDQRTDAQCEAIHAACGGIEGLVKLTNNRMLTGYTGGKVLWLREHEPEHYARFRHLLNPKDYIRLCLTGELATEVSDASGTGLFDVANRRWSERLLDLLGISREILPDCVESAGITGTVSAGAAAATGLPAGIPVVGGGGDAVIQTTGMGIVRPGVLGIILGTGGIVTMGLDRFTPNPEGRLQLFCNNAPGLWHAMGVNLACGSSLRWYRDALCEQQRTQAQEQGRDPYEIMMEQAAASPPGSRGLMFVPYLSGERCPYPDPHARGGFIGLGLEHTRADITRAVVEGVSFNLRDSAELIRAMHADIQEIRVSGGGASSALWRRIVADVFQAPVTTVTGAAEGGAFGAALVAGVGIQVWPDIQAAVGVSTRTSETIPEPANSRRYEDLYGIFREFYPTLKPSFERLAGLADQA